MPLRITNSVTDVATLNRWAEDIETQLNKTTKVAHSAVATLLGKSGLPVSLGTVTSVGFTGPKEATITGSPITSSGVINWAWAPETPGTVFEVPPVGLGSFEGLNSDAKPTGQTLSVSMTPITSSSFAMLLQAGNATGIVTPTGWTSINSAFVNTKTITGLSPVAVSEPLTGAGSLGGAASLVLFQGPAPSLVQTKAVSGSLSGTISYTSSNTSGNTLMVAIDIVGSSSGFAGLTVSDSNGNQYQQLVNQSAIAFPTSPFITVQNSLWVATNCQGGANTVTFSITYSTGVNSTSTIAIMEFGPLTTGTFTPSFNNLLPSQIPAINLQVGGPGGIAGILKTINGGTGTGNAATGTAGGVVLSNSPTITTPTISGAIPSYDGFSTAGIGLSPILGIVDKTAQSAAITTTTIVTPLVATQCRLSWDAKVTTAATTSSQLGALTVTYTDPDGVVQTITAPAFSAAGLLDTTIPGADTGNTTTTVLLGSGILLNIKAVTAIQYAFAYASTGATAMQYNLHIRVEAMG